MKLAEQIKAGTYKVDVEGSSSEMLHEAIHTFPYVDDKHLKPVERLRCHSPGTLEIVVGCSPDGSPMPRFGDEIFPDLRLLDGKVIRLSIIRFPDTADSDRVDWQGMVSVYFEAGDRPQCFGRQILRAVINP